MIFPLISFIFFHLHLPLSCITWSFNFFHIKKWVKSSQDFKAYLNFFQKDSRLVWMIFFFLFPPFLALLSLSVCFFDRNDTSENLFLHSLILATFLCVSFLEVCENSVGMRHLCETKYACFRSVPCRIVSLLSWLDLVYLDLKGFKE